jgi:hypothetical protein
MFLVEAVFSEAWFGVARGCGAVDILEWFVLSAKAK